MSIELGFAPLVLPSGRRVSVVDVPGHERFVRTMVAGATGIDFYLMVIAADDGVMPQTLEHAEVLAALGIEQGVVAITKSDRASPESAAAEAAELFPNAEIVACSARTGDGVADVAAALERVAERVTPRGEGRREGAAVLHIDRAFTIHGAGTVVTGTLWSGTLTVGDTLNLLPAQRPVRVRSLQVHDEPARSGRTRGSAWPSTSPRSPGATSPAAMRSPIRRRSSCRRRSSTRRWISATTCTAAASWCITARGRWRRGWRRSAPGCGRCASRHRCSPPRATGSSCARSRRPTRSPAARARSAGPPAWSPCRRAGAPGADPARRAGARARARSVAGRPPHRRGDGDRDRVSGPALEPDAIELAARLLAAGHEPLSRAELERRRGASAQAHPGGHRRPDRP